MQIKKLKIYHDQKLDGECDNIGFNKNAALKRICSSLSYFVYPLRIICINLKYYSADYSVHLTRYSQNNLVLPYSMGLL